MSECQTPDVVETETERLQRLRRNLTCDRWKREQTIWTKINEYVGDFDAQAYLVLQRNGEKEYQIYNSLAGKNWAATSKNFTTLMTTEFPVPDLRTPDTMGPTKKQRAASGVSPEEEYVRPRRATAEEIAAYLADPGEEFDPSALTIRQARRLTVLKDATLAQEIEANMSRRSTAPKHPTSARPAARPLLAPHARRPVQPVFAPAPRPYEPVPRTPARRLGPASTPAAIADISSTMSAGRIAAPPRLTSSLTMSEITRAAQHAAPAQHRLPAGNYKALRQSSELLPPAEMPQDRAGRTLGFHPAPSWTPSITVSRAMPTVTRPVTVFKHGGDDIQTEGPHSHMPLLYARGFFTDVQNPVQDHGRGKRAPGWEPVEDAFNDRGFDDHGEYGGPICSPRRSKRQRRR